MVEGGPPPPVTFSRESIRIGNFGTNSLHLLPLLRQLASDEDEEVRAGAGEALAKLGSK